MYKKIYLEVTNNCNLNCSFCNKHNREKKFITIDDFKYILNEIKPYTNFLYFHVMGEPLLHPKINDLIDIAVNDFYINITTNGFLIDRVKNNKNIRQINISLHSFDNCYNKEIDDYLNNIFDSTIELLKNNTIVNYRLWVSNKYKNYIINSINKRFNVIIDSSKKKIKDNLFFEIDEEFVWPNLNNNYYNEVGTCKGTIDHIGILVDGTIVPCCLDSNAVINLGNIFSTSLNDIINSKRYINMQNGLKCNNKVEELCKKCNFYEERTK